MVYERYVRCGKPNCSKCKSGPGHGPYTYESVRVGTTVTGKYRGKAKVVVPKAAPRKKAKKPVRRAKRGKKK